MASHPIVNDFVNLIKTMGYPEPKKHPRTLEKQQGTYYGHAVVVNVYNQTLFSSPGDRQTGPS